MGAIWPDHIDRGLPLTKTQRKTIHRDAWRMWMRSPWNFLLYLALPFTYFLALRPVRDLAGQLASGVGLSGLGFKLARAGAMVGLAIVLFVVGGMVLQRVRFAPLVYRATRRTGYDVCRRCGYWLRELDAGISRCPECGAKREPDRRLRVLVTWPTYGHWFPGHGRGRIDHDRAAVDRRLPEPSLCGEAVGQAASRWPAVRLDEAQRRVVRTDLERVAGLREFVVDDVVVAPTFVHLLIGVAPERDLSRLVQLVKGALARALTVAEGDRPARDAAGVALPHHKWWSRQWACLEITDEALRERVVRALGQP